MSKKAIKLKNKTFKNENWFAYKQNNFNEKDLSFFAVIQNILRELFVCFPIIFLNA